MKRNFVGALRLAVSAACLSATTGASAYQFEYGELRGTLDTTVSAGVSVRMEDPSAASVSIANGGSSRSTNDDDGNLNYEKGDLISATLKANHDLVLEYGDWGAFSRVVYFFDNESRSRNDCNYGSVQAVNCLGPEAHERLDNDFEVLDLFAYTSLYVGERRLNLRAGEQVINWGESTFIGNSINSINPVDVAKLRTPGAEIKEALLPSPILYAGYELSDAASIEGFWILSYDKTRIDPRGSFFSTNDFISDDGNRVFVGFGRRNDQHQPYAPPATAGPPDDMGNPTVVPNPTAQVWLPRAGDRRPNGADQYGAALRYLSDLNDTEFGFYYLNYHSRTPLVSAIRGTSTNLLNEPSGGGSARYFADFPEAIDLYGVSFNTGGPYGIALQGEYSYRPNQPVQLAAVEVLLASLGLPNNITGNGTTTVADGPDADSDPDTVSVASQVPVGTEITGFRRVDMHQLQVTGTKAFGPTIGASQFVVLGEVAFNQLDLTEGLLFNAPGASLPAPGSANAAGGSFQQEGYADEFSWGYRLLARMDFEDAIGPAQLSPRFVFAHDVHGSGPNFNQDTKAVTLGLAFNYLQRWQADIAYTGFFDGRVYSGTDASPPPAGQSASYAINANPNRDRDFLAVSVSYAF